jgi:BNR/Asp-box repeat
MLDPHALGGEVVMRHVVSRLAVGAVLALLAGTAPGVPVVHGVRAAPPRPQPVSVDVSRRAGNESEETIAVNPTNPDNIVIVTNIAEGAAGLFAGVSFDGGRTWANRIIGNGDNLGDSCCDPSLAFDQYGNLFLAYLFNVENTVPVALSTDGGRTFNLIANIPKPDHVTGAGERQGIFRFVDQETITTGNGMVWLVVNGGGPMVATGARVSGFGQVGAFAPVEIIPGTNNCTYGDVAIGPAGQVMNVCTLTESGQGGGSIFVSVDPDGLGPAGFGDRVKVADTHVGGFDFIPAQPDRSIDAEPGLAWDRTGGPHGGRAYLVYTLETKNESGDTDIEVQYSDDAGLTWSPPVRVNDDMTRNSQFLPKIALDPTTGHIGVAWYDARNDLGRGGPGDTDGIANTDAQLWGAFSSDGRTFTPNIRISAGTSNSHDSANSIDYGDYSGLAFYGGILHPAWSDNSNSDGLNPDGTLHTFDIFSAAVAAP